MKNKFFFLFISFFFISEVYAQVGLNSPAQPVFKFDKEYIVPASMAGASLLSFTIDGSVREFAQDNRGDFGDALFTVPDIYGDGWTTVALTGGLILGGLAFDDVYVEKTGYYVLESAALTSAVTYLLKMSLGRSRPYTNDGPYKFNFFQFNTRRMAFPSGHSSNSFSNTAILAYRIDRTYAYAGLYTLAALTMAARIYYDKHWLSDTFMGAAIGTACALLVLELNDALPGDNDNSGINEEPGLFNPNIQMINISIPF